MPHPRYEWHRRRGAFLFLVGETTTFRLNYPEMKDNETVCAMLFKSYDKDGSYIPHNVVVTGLGKDGEIQFWDNATRSYSSTSINNVIEGYEFSGPGDPWGRYQMIIKSDPSKYMFNEK